MFEENYGTIEVSFENIFRNVSITEHGSSEYMQWAGLNTGIFRNKKAFLLT